MFGHIVESGVKQSRGQLTIESLAARMEQLQDRVKILESIIAGQPSTVRKARTTAFDLTDEQQAIFDRAVKAGLMERTTDGHYHWLASKALLSYFCGRVFCGDRPKRDCDGNVNWKQTGRMFPQSKAEALFGATGIADYRRKREWENVPIIDEFEVLGDKLGYYFDQFRAAYNHLNLVYLKFDLKWYTEKVQEADRQRIEAFRELRDTIRFNLTYPKTEAVGEAARILMEIIELYGCVDMTRLRMQERTTAITNLIEDYEEKYSSQIEALALGDLLDTLKERQADFMEKYLARNDKDSELSLNAMADARKRMTEAYRDLVTAVNLMAKRDAEGELDGFIDRLNVEIRKNFVNTGQSASSAGGSGTTDGTTGSESGAAVKNATFEFVGGNSVKLRVEVDTPLTALPNTLGYKWKPDVPALMPNRNIVFREVPLEDREVTATFHFFDHTEEEVRARVGAALTAPQNTDGYYWSPAVPAVMPDDDTSYYELPVEENGGGSGSTGSGSGSGSGSETQTWPVINPNDPTVYTGILHQGSTYRTVSGTVGTPIEIPEPEEGMMWPTNMPSVMPACDFQAYTMPVDSDVTTLYKLEYKDGDTILRTDHLPAGDIVFLYAAPDGKHWTNTPRYGKMPARDWTVYTVED